MIIKKFQAKTEEEATEIAKKELGENIVIMNVRKVKRKGIFAFFQGPFTEVTVALEEERERMAEISKSVKKIKEVAEKSVQTTPEKSVNADALEEKLDSLQNLLVQQMKKKEPEVETKDESPEEVEEKEPTEVEKFIRLLYNTMLDNEVDEKYANQFLSEAEKMHKPNRPFDYVLAGVYQKIILKFGQAEEIKPAEKGPKVVLFVGPTGVGKTTTIAKLASMFYVEKKKKVALLTADTYRIAAAEQLRTYANILEAPFRIIYTAEELNTAIQDFSEYDYIFIDTAGHSHKNTEQKTAVEEFIKTAKEHAEADIFLVLSATTKYKDLIAIADAYKEFENYKLIFTKLDETSAYGNLLNLRLYTGASMSYITCGQNVPDDIEVFNPQKTVKKLLGGKQTD